MARERERKRAMVQFTMKHLPPTDGAKIEFAMEQLPPTDGAKIEFAMEQLPPSDGAKVVCHGAIATY